MTSSGPQPPVPSPMSKSIHPLYLAQGNVFIFNAGGNKAWTPLRPFEVPISILYDESRSIYRIISMDLTTPESKKVLINSTLLPQLEFHKTSDNFGHWTDVTGKIYGIGFLSQFELNAFEDSLTKAQNAIYTLVKQEGRKSAGDGPARQVQQLSSVVNQSKSYLYPSGERYGNWQQLLQYAKKTNAKVPTILVPEPGNGEKGQGESVDQLPPFPPTLKHQLQQQHQITLQQQCKGEGGGGPRNPSLEALKKENEKLRQVTIESCTNAKKWEDQIASVKNENEILGRKVSEASKELEELGVKEVEFKSALIKWQECVGKKKAPNPAELEEQIRKLKQENEGIRQELERGRLAFDPQLQAALDRTRQSLDQVRRENEQGRAVFERVDSLFVQAINELITVRGKLAKNK